MKKVRIDELYDLNETRAKSLLESKTYPWEVLPLIKDFIIELGQSLPADEFENKGNNVWIHKTAKIYPNANIYGPCIIDAETEVRPGAFIRGNALVGKKCVVGNSTELKNVILFMLYLLRTGLQNNVFLLIYLWICNGMETDLLCYPS